MTPTQEKECMIPVNRHHSFFPFNLLFEFFESRKQACTRLNGQDNGFDGRDSAVSAAVNRKRVKRAASFIRIKPDS